MNDRHRYRGKRVDTGEWVTGWLVHDDLIRDANRGGILSTKGMAAEGHFDCEIIRIDANTITQCTGLKDKTGRLIFEGDAVKYRHTDSENTNTTEVIYSRYGWALKNTALPFEIFAKAEIEIIGDIYTNPELVGGEKANEY